MTRFQPARHPQTRGWTRYPAKHRTFIDASTVSGGGSALLYAYNLYAANKSDYSLADRDVAVVVGFRHAATAFGFNDTMWRKYRKVTNATLQLTDPKTKQPPTTNLFYSVDYGLALTNFGVTIESLLKQGTRLAICEMPTHGLAGSIAADTGGTEDAVYHELVANAIPNARMVAAGMLAVSRAQ